MISEFFTQSGTIVRQTWSNDSSVETTIDTINLHIQPGIRMRQGYEENFAQRFTKPHTMWCAEGENLKEDDKITINSEEYSVKYISHWNVGDDDDHLEIILEKLDG